MTKRKHSFIFSRKRLLLFIAIVLIFSLSGCRSESYMYNDDISESEKILDSLLVSLDKKNENSIKKLFSKKVLETVQDIDEGIRYLFNFYEGNLISKEWRTSPSYSEIEDGVKIKYLEGVFNVKTDKEEYLIYFSSCVEDSSNEKNIGVEKIQVIFLKDKKEQFFWGNNFENGIYMPENRTVISESE